jgi:SAM-dependent MidA family methyltransferase
VAEGPTEPGGRAGRLARLIADHIGDQGPIGFDEYVAHALYAPGLGFYRRGGGAGRRRDFITSPEVGPLFGAVLARALDSWWDQLGRPDSFVLVEAGAGPGTLARSMRAARPRCLPVLHHVLVEVGEGQWATHPDGVTARVDLPSPGDLPAGPVVVLANELLDNLPFALVEKVGDGWAEVAVGSAPAGVEGGAGLREVLRPLPADRQRWCDLRAGDDAPVGARLPVHHDAAAWLADALGLVAPSGGRVVVIDYASTSADLARRPWTDWVRTYAAHGRAGHPLVDAGGCDITTEVAVDQLALIAAPTTDRSQHQFLRAHGLADLVAEGRDRWAAGGVRGGLAALEGRSRVLEAEALTDREGLGAFRVLEWVVATVSADH